MAPTQGRVARAERRWGCRRGTTQKARGLVLLSKLIRAAVPSKRKVLCSAFFLCSISRLTVKLNTNTPWHTFWNRVYNDPSRSSKVVDFVTHWKLVTLLLSRTISEIFVRRKPLFPHPSPIAAKILGRSPWSRSVMLGSRRANSVENEHLKLKLTVQFSKYCNPCDTILQCHGRIVTYLSAPDISTLTHSRTDRRLAIAILCCVALCGKNSINENS